MGEGSQIFRFYERASATGSGLVLFNPPTGSGKSYQMVEFIRNTMAKEEMAGTAPEKMRRAIVTTVQIKNLPAKEAFGECAKYALRIESAIDSVRSALGPAMDVAGSRDRDTVWKNLVGRQNAEIPEIRKLYARTRARFARLVDCDEEYESRCKGDPASAVRYRSELNSEIKKYEGALGEALAETLFMGKRPDPVAFAKKAEPETSPYHWISKLFPGVLLPVKPIVILTTKKMMWGVARVVAPRLRFFSEGADYIKGSVIFIDEFDSTKQDMLDVIIETMLQVKNDDMIRFAVDFARNVRDYEAVPRHSEGGALYLEEPLREHLRKIADIFADIVASYNLDKGDCLFEGKTVADVLNSGLFFRDYEDSFLFSDGSTNGYLRIDYDQKKEFNRVTMTGEKPGDEHSVALLLARLDGAINAALDIVYKIGRWYVIKERGKKRELTIEEGCRTVVNNLRLDTYEGFLGSVLKQETKTAAWRDESREEKARRRLVNDESIYGRGFSLTRLENSLWHNDTTKITATAFKIFPETLLLNLASRACVIGISATATSRHYRNYDLSYLRKMLGPRFHSPASGEDTLRDSYAAATEEYERGLSGYSKVRIHAEFVDAEDKEEAWRRLEAGMDRGDALELRKYVEAQVREQVREGIVTGAIARGRDAGEQEWRLKRYLRLMLGCGSLRAKGIKSLLYCSNVLARAEGTFRDGTVQKLAESIFRGSDAKLAIVDSGGYNKTKMEDTKRELREGKARLVLSSYKTIGSGVNIQYGIPDGIQTVRVKETPAGSAGGGGEKDFDAIHLEMPTHVLPSLGNWQGQPDDWEKPEKEFIKWIYAMQYLYQMGDISEYTKVLLLKAGAYNYASARNARAAPQKAKEMKDRAIKLGWSVRDWRNNTASLAEGAYVVLKQAIGRLSRTSNKSPDIYIFVDSDIRKLDILKYAVPEPMTPEFAAFCKLLQDDATARAALGPRASDAGDAQPALKVFREEVVSKNRKIVRLSSRLRNHKDGVWPETDAEAWKSLRETCLKFPSADDADCLKNGLLDVLYVNQRPVFGGQQETELEPCVYYKETAQLEALQPEDVANAKSKEYCLFLDGQTLGLTTLLKNGFIRKRFEERGYALEIAAKKFVMSPYMALFIYRGALGEAGGRAVLESYRFGDNAKIEIEDLPPRGFETFDGRIRACPEFCVDFKLWNTNHRKLEEIVEDMSRKVRNYPECRYVLYADVYARRGGQDFAEATVDGKKIKIFVVSSLLSPENPATLDPGAEDFIAWALKEAMAAHVRTSRADAERGREGSENPDQQNQEDC